MNLPVVGALCDCNSSAPSSQQTVECYISAKDLLPSCKPILKATMRNRCGFRRMIISTFILLLIVAFVYCMCTSGQRIRSLSRSLRGQPQPSSPPTISPEDSMAEQREVIQDT